MNVMKKKNVKPRNHELAVVLKNDPARLKIRTVESEQKKLIKSRSRRKSLNQDIEE